jgi:hypothetical protein
MITLQLVSLEPVQTANKKSKLAGDN